MVRVLGAVTVVVLGGWLVLVRVFLESDRIGPWSPVAWLVIHPGLRSVEPVGQCGPVVYSRSFQECGGICGERQSVRFGTVLDHATVEASYDVDAIRRRMGYDEADIFLMTPPPGEDPNCPWAVISFYDDFAREAP